MIFCFSVFFCKRKKDMRNRTKKERVEKLWFLRAEMIVLLNDVVGDVFWPICLRFFQILIY